MNIRLVLLAVAIGGAWYLYQQIQSALEWFSWVPLVVA